MSRYIVDTTMVVSLIIELFCNTTESWCRMLFQVAFNPGPRCQQRPHLLAHLLETIETIGKKNGENNRENTMVPDKLRPAAGDTTMWQEVWQPLLSGVLQDSQTMAKFRAGQTHTQTRESEICL